MAGSTDRPGVFYEVDSTMPIPRPRPHGDFCTEECRQLASPCHLGRPRRKPVAPNVPCPHCGATAGSPCRSMTREQRRLTLAPNECHPSRLEAGAA